MPSSASAQPSKTVDAITSYIVPQKQSAKRHYGSHQYFTKRAWNLVQAYIANYTEPGDLFCDPFGGSGVTIVEALVLNRRGLYLDISRWATFLASQVALAPVNLGNLEQAFLEVESKCRKRINAIMRLSNERALAIKPRRWYPKNHPLPKNADVPLVEDLFTPRHLLALSELYHAIGKVSDPICRDLLRYAFSRLISMPGDHNGQMSSPPAEKKANKAITLCQYSACRDVCA